MFFLCFLIGLGTILVAAVFWPFIWRVHPVPGCALHVRARVAKEKRRGAWDELVRWVRQRINRRIVEILSMGSLSEDSARVVLWRGASSMRPPGLLDRLMVKLSPSLELCPYFSSPGLSSLARGVGRIAAILVLLLGIMGIQAKRVQAHTDIQPRVEKGILPRPVFQGFASPALPGDCPPRVLLSDCPLRIDALKNTLAAVDCVTGKHTFKLKSGGGVHTNVQTGSHNNTPHTDSYKPHTDTTHSNSHSNNIHSDNIHIDIPPR